MSVSALESIIDKDGEDKAYACHSKGKVIGIGLTDTQGLLGIIHNLDGRCRCKHGTDIDGHIEKREATVAFVGKFRSIVQTSDHYLQVALEKTCSEADKKQGHSHSGYGNKVTAKRKGKHKVTDKHDDNTRSHHFAKTETVGSNTTDDREEVNHHQKGGIDDTRSTGSPSEIGLEIEEEDGQHGVIAETLAGVGQRKSPKAFWLSFKHRNWGLVLKG